MILFKNILARILKNNLDFFFKIIFQDYFAKILKNNSSVGWYSISRRGHSVTRRVGYSWAASGGTIIEYLRVPFGGTGSILPLPFEGNGGAAPFAFFTLDPLQI